MFPKVSKYGARKIKTADGMIFDSKKEMNRYFALKQMEEQGMIKDLKRQVPYELVPHQLGENGKVLERAITYYADFTYHDETTGEFVVEDVKGYRTEAYKIKRKLMLFLHDIQIREV